MDLIHQMYVFSWYSSSWKLMIFEIVTSILLLLFIQFDFIRQPRKSRVANQVEKRSTNSIIYGSCINCFLVWGWMQPLTLVYVIYFTDKNRFWALAHKIPLNVILDIYCVSVLSFSEYFYCWNKRVIVGQKNQTKY